MQLASMNVFCSKASDTGEAGGHGPLTFLGTKKKRGKQRKKERVSKQKLLLKGCHQGQKVTVLAILERLELKHFSCRPTMVADYTFQCYMAPPL